MASQQPSTQELSPFSRDLSLPWEKVRTLARITWFSVVRFLQPSVAVARCRSIAPARRGGPLFSHPFGRCGHDLIKCPTSEPARRDPLPPDASRSHHLPNPRRSRSHPCFRTIVPGTSHLWRRRCSSALCAEGSSRPLSDP